MLTFYDFTDEDLKSNRNGFITPRQKEWIQGFAKGISGMQRGNAKIAIVFPFIGLCMILAMSLSNERARAAFLSDPTYLIVLVLVVPFVAGIFAISIYFADRRAARLSEASLKKAEGSVKFDEESSRVGTTYFVYVGETEFKFGEDVSRYFAEGGVYRIFYCETSMLKLILSHERVR
ncbi:MAG: hypothetical protein IH588_15780 [Anaerolineales bacterium]|nr:hypothetical protein [Anaerolineales bacterium]